FRDSIEQERPYALAFIDMRMPPGIDGLETAMRLLNLDPELQVVICTAYSDYSWDQMIGKVGHSDRLLILKKPFEAIEVLQLAHALTGKWELSHALTGRMADLEVLVGERTHELAASNQQLRDEIAERTRAEAQIREQAALLDKAKDAILVRGMDDIIHFWNKSAEQLFGWTAEEAIGRTVTDLLYADTTLFQEARQTVMEKGVWIGELLQRSKAGREISVEGHWSLVCDEEGHPKSILSINTDITERKLLQSQLVRAQRMESLGTMAGGIAHDLNNTLSPITMAISLLKTTVQDPESLGILEILETSAQHGADMVRQVLSFARGVTGERALLQPKYLIQELRKISADTFPKNIEIRTSIAPGLWNVTGDSTQLYQVLLNLSVNARDALPGGGGIVISATNETLDAPYAAMNSEAKAGPYVVIEVRDTGTGIPAGIVEKIFDPFFTTKAMDKGTGLGLSTSLGIVRSHGGFIRVTSEVGKGTSFRVYLPAETGSHISATELSPPELPRGNGEWVLVIDDEESIRTVTQHALEAFGYRVITATEGAEAIAIYARRSSEIAVVLTDMMMPMMDGAMTISVLRRMNPGVKIIASSGLKSEEHLSGVAGGGTPYFLAKPYTADALLRMLAEVLRPKITLLPSLAHAVVSSEIRVA
ncbi:MAG: response regulator, partial [Chthoniobacteraceae bacterium]